MKELNIGDRILVIDTDFKGEEWAIVDKKFDDEKNKYFYCRGTYGWWLSTEALQKIDRFSKPLLEIDYGVRFAFPDLEFSYDWSRNETGSSFLDIYKGKITYTIEHKPKEGFGLYIDQANYYGARPDEFFQDEDAVIKRLTELLGTN